jgi:hypothetical protein
LLIRPLFRSRLSRVGLIGVLVLGWCLATVGAFADVPPLLGAGVLVVGVASAMTAKLLLELGQVSASARSSLPGHDLARLRTQVRAGRQDIRQLGERLTSMRRGSRAIGGRLQVLETQVARLQSEVAARDERISKLENALRTRVDPSLDVLSGRRHQQLDRRMTRQSVRELEETWLPRLGLTLSSQGIHYLERRVVAIENLCIGRLAASTSDAVFRMLVTRSVQSDRVEVLEIGVLYGVNAALLWDSSGAGSQLRQTLVDRFSGYYGPDSVDRFTGLILTEDLVKENLRRVGMSPDSARIVKGSSQDRATINLVDDRAYDIVLIDADHSYEGLASDFSAYATMVRKGGYVLVDDYGAPGWPDVARFIDNASYDKEFELLGTYGQTAALRRRGSPGDFDPIGSD